MRSIFKRNKKKSSSKDRQEDSQGQSKQPINASLSANLDVIKQKTGNSSDIVFRTLKMGRHSEIKAAVVYVKGMVDSQAIHDFLIESMMNNRDLHEKLIREKTMAVITEEVVAFGGIKPVSGLDELLSSLMSGETAILVDGISEALIASTRAGDKRSIQEPTTQLAIRGSKESFIESSETNIAMVRRIINNPNLWVESMKLGKVTKTDVSIMYVNGIAKDEIIKEVRQRLKKINLDGILESGYIEQLIEDQTMTTFPTLYHTERPDVVAGNLLEGRVAIFVNGTPFVLLAPAVFIQFFQSVDDYYARFDIATAIRFLRIFTFFISILGPAVYIAATTFHQEMIPTGLLIIVAAQRESVPFPAFVEAVIMEIIFEILREAGVRMPKAIGSTISIVGALVIGQAAVQAGIVSPAMVIIVSITAIANFATPSVAIAISARLIRFLFMVSAATFGFYGIILALIVLTVHLCSLRSFGIPYMSPLAPFIPTNAGDTIVRKPWWMFKERPRLMAAGNNVRSGENQQPQPPEDREIKMNAGKGERNES
ncbi:spore germination protein [Domibacillus antri]|uniref:Spore germination protein n=1 Tax=Domibacillus antri TaxID=1714264 RepID=A0A1Q8Q270_9BACI|nr:spore germination protein [Domibacillus antri]OLN21439.1 spore germination protein [Domibacillus antri]